MINFFGTDITNNKNNDEVSGNIYRVKQIDQQKEARIDRIIENENEYRKAASLPFSLKLVKLLCGYFAFLEAVVLLESIMKKVPFSRLFHNAPIMILAAPVCLIVWLLLRIREKKLASTVIESAEYEQLDRDAERLFGDIQAELGVPNDAVSIDAILERYIIKNGEPKHRDFGINPYINIETKMYIKEERLCIADLQNLWEVPLTSLDSIELVNKKIGFPFWNKEEPYNSEKYKPFKITVNNYGQFFSKYYRIKIHDALGDFFMMIPEYDGKPFMDLTGLKVSQ